MIFVYDGNTGQGKTYMLAHETLGLLERNKKWWEKKKIKEKRFLVTNMALADHIVAEYKEYILYWQNLEQLQNIRNADVIFDDMATYLDSQRWSETPLSIKRWLRLHEHYGCNIYANAQDFSTIDISVRRLTGQVQNVKKIIGSRRPSATKPEVKWIWGLLFIRDVDEKDYKTERNDRKYTGIPRIEFIKRKICNVFDTTQDFDMGKFPPLQHIQRECLECGKTHVKHL